MAEWAPPESPGSRRDDNVGCFLVVSTPDGFTSRWEDVEPPAAVGSEVAEFARRMRDVDLAQVRRIDPPPHLRRQLVEYDEPTGDDSPPQVTPGEEFGRVVYLRLRARPRPPEQAASSAGEIVVDFDFGPMGAPPSYPRVSVNDLFRYAAENG